MVRALAIGLMTVALAALAGLGLAGWAGTPTLRAPDLAQSPVERFGLGRDVHADRIALEQRAAAAHAVNNRRHPDARARTVAAHPGHRLLAPRDPARTEERRRIEAAMAEAEALSAALDRQMAELDRMDRAYTAQFLADPAPVRVWRGDSVQALPPGGGMAPAPERETAPVGGDRGRPDERGVGGGEGGRAPVIAGG